MANELKTWILQLNSDQKAERREAVRALSYMGSQAVPALVDELVAGTTPVTTVAEVLKAIGVESEVPLENLLAHESPEVRQRAAETMRFIQNPQSAIPLVTALQDKVPAVRAAVAQALGGFNEPRAVTALISCLSDPDEEVRTAAAESLGNYTRDPRVRPALISSLQKDSPSVRRGAARALAHFHDEETRQALNAATADEDELVRQYAAAALQLQSGDRMVFKRLDQQASDVTEIVQSAIAAINDDNELNTEDMNILRHSNPLVRARLLDYVSETGAQNAVSLILPSLNDINPAVRKAGIDALVRIGDKALTPLAEHMSSRSPSIREGILEALGLIASPLSIPTLQNALQDADVAVRLQAVRSLIQLDDPAAGKALEIALRDTDRTVRDEARQHLNTSKPAGTLGRFLRRLRGDG